MSPSCGEGTAMGFPHLWFAVIMVGLPLAAGVSAERLRQNRMPGGRIGTYAMTMGCLWVAALAVVWRYGWNDVWYAKETLRLTGWGRTALGLGVAYFLLMNVVPLFFLKHPEFRRRLKESSQDRSFLYPVSRREKWTFFALALTVGITEEILFRFFLTDYLRTLPLPVTLSPEAALSASALLFGLYHWKQGPAAMVNTAVFGWLLGCLYGSAGSLLAPAVLHAVFDLKPLLFLRADRSMEPPGTAASQ
jgi:Predicted metal-dependent membrane protease